MRVRLNGGQRFISILIRAERVVSASRFSTLRSHARRVFRSTPVRIETVDCLQTIKSYSFSGNLRSQKNILQEGRRVFGERDNSKEYAAAMVDAKGNFYIDCLRPGKWVFTSNFRDLYKNYPTIDIEITDKNETYDWVVHR